MEMKYFMVKVSAVLYLLLVVFFSCHLPFSMFFNLLHDETVLFKGVENSNRIRTEQSRKYFSSLNSTSSLTFYNKRVEKEQVDFAVGIITIKRESENEVLGYLQQSVSSIDILLKNKPIFNNSIGFICNVDIHPSQHKDALELYPYVPYVERYGKSSVNISDILIPHHNKPFHKVIDHQTIYQKETYDYVFCLLAAAKFKPRFIMLVEEDTIPHQGFADFLDHLINFRLKIHDTKNFAFMKFYYPAKWQGFAYDFVELCDLISFCIVGGTIFSFVGYFCLPPHLVNNKRRLFTVGFLLSIITCYGLGKQNVNNFRRLSNHLYRMKSSEACCTQAVLYPTWVLEDLPSFMITESGNTHTDLVIWDYVIEKKVAAYQIEPNLFYHTGLYSSLALAQKHPIEFIIP